MTQLNNVVFGIIVSVVVTTLVVVIGWTTGLFWDNVLFINKMGAPLMEFGPLAWGRIPVRYDPGHPPFMATYLSLIWRFWERSLQASHIAMIPFIFGFCYMLWNIVITLFKEQIQALAAFVLVLADPTVFCQLMYIGPDVFVLCFASMVIYGILIGERRSKTIGLMLLGITSLRGMMICLGLFLWDVSRHLLVEKKSLHTFIQLRNICVYFLGALPSVTFVVWRLVSKGWIISNPLHPWGNAWDFINIADFIYNFVRNCVVFAWRLLDFGRVIPFLCTAIIIWIYRHQFGQLNKCKSLLLFCLLSCSIVAGTSLLIRNPMGHSYYLLVYIGVELLFVSVLNLIKKKIYVYAFVLCSLLAGNRIVYPDNISQGWPSSLASMPFWSLRSEILTEIDQRNIPVDKVYVLFPFGTCADDIDLSGDTRPYAKQIEEAEFLLASNICNLDDETLEILPAYEIISSHQRGGVWITLYHLTP